MRVALAQINPVVGDIQGNCKIILNACRHAAKQNADLVLTPELSLWGYPPKDLLFDPRLLKSQKETLNVITQAIALETPTLKVLIGIAEPINSHRLPNLFNAVALIDKSGWRVIARKQLLPTYDVFDEKRYFRPAEDASHMELKVDGKVWNCGITICEDLWVDDGLHNQRIEGPDPIENLVSKKIDLLINLSASPFSQDKTALRKKVAQKAQERLKCPVIYLNQVGGNDELIFDGSSFVLGKKAELSLQLPACHEDLSIWDSARKNSSNVISRSHKQQELFEALVLGVRDYAKKCGFHSTIIGLSGGIDSALVTTIATAALGRKKVNTLLMPSQWSSVGSIEDALGIAERLGITAKTIKIENLINSFHSSLKAPLGQAPEGITAENLQSRIRGILLMSFANQHGHLLLSTGNKSELAVGYCTLYGDMNGGLSVIGDLYKTYVFRLCEWLDSKDSSQCRLKLGLSSKGQIIGEEILSKPPSAELRPGQLDSDSLPDYEILDPILQSFIEERRTTKELINSGNDPQLINHIESLLKKAEFKRRQAPPLLKVSNQAFGSGWRIPIAAK